MTKTNIPTANTSLEDDKVSTNTANTSPSTPDKKTQPPPTTTPPPLPISDLIYDLSPKTISSIPAHFSSIRSSKHAPDFRVRNQAKILRLSDILSDLSLHLAMAKKKQNQLAFDALYARIVKAGEGLNSLAQPELERSETVLPCEQGESWGWWVNGQEKAGWYAVRHGDAGEDVQKHEELSRERVSRARREYEAKFETQAADARDEALDGDVAGTDEDSKDEVQQSEGFESQETTLVEGLEELEGLHPTLSAALDGGGCGTKMWRSLK